MSILQHKTTIRASIAAFAGLAALTSAFLAADSVSAWGPERDVFTMENPATYPTFNSITNNPTIGDERDFVRIGEVDADVTSLGNSVEIVPGRQYLVYVYFHNNAASIYNSSAYNNAGVALRTTMSSSFSTVITPEESGTVTATITADNSTPRSVWDEAYMTTTTDKVLMHYVVGSAKIYNDWAANGSIMPSTLFTEGGALVGLNALNGVIPGCEEYHGVVTYVLEAEELSGTIEKTVSKDGTNYAETAQILPGDEVYFRLTIRNAGDVTLTNATVRDELPSGLTLVPGSVVLSAEASENEQTLSDNLTDTGYNLGRIGTGNVVYLNYRAKAGDDFDCDSLNLVNTAYLTYDSETSSGDTVTDLASVVVEKDDCAPAPAPTPEEDTCLTNPNLPGCQEIPSTGPLEIVLAVIIVLGITGTGFYLYRTHRTLRTVKDTVSGKSSDQSESSADPKVSDSSEKPKDSETPKDSAA